MVGGGLEGDGGVGNSLPPKRRLWKGRKGKVGWGWCQISPLRPCPGVLYWVWKCRQHRLWRGGWWGRGVNRRGMMADPNAGRSAAAEILQILRQAGESTVGSRRANDANYHPATP